MAKEPSPSSSPPPPSPPPFSKSADNNKDHILDQLRACLTAGDVVLEVASGTGQHGLHFSKNLPDVTWQCSDLDLDTFALAETLAQNSRANLPAPLVLDIAAWPALPRPYEAVYSANCIHIIPDALVQPYVEGAARALKPGGLMLLYGPYKYGGEFTTPSNADFNVFLQKTYAGGGIKDFETLDAHARAHGLTLAHDIAMPANNQFLTWRKEGP